MFSEKYKAAMSFSVPQELVEKTARLMQEAARPVPNETAGKVKPLLRHPPAHWKQYVLVAAAFALVVISGGYLFSRMGVGVPNPDSAPAAAPDMRQRSLPAPATGGINGGEEAAQDAPQNDIAAYDVILEKGTDGAAPLAPFTFSLTSVGGYDAPLVVAPTAAEVMNSENPWTLAVESELQTLPVYSNSCVLDGEDIPVNGGGISDAEMKTMAADTAVRLKLTLLPHDEENNRYAYNSQGGRELTGYVEHCSEGTEISVRRNGAVSVQPAKETSPLVSGSTAEQLKAVSLQYTNFFESSGFENPTFSMATDYSLSEVPRTQVIAYDKRGTLTEQIVSFNLNPVRAAVLTPSSPESSVCYTPPVQPQSQPFWQQPMGDYPLQTVREATNALLAGEYEAALPGAPAVTEDAVEGVELLYYGNEHTEFVQPVYQFYVKLSWFNLPEVPKGQNVYGIYLVPAVSGEYIAAG